MTDIQKWILQLQSDNPNKRYEACEELRVTPSITDEALDALHEASNDPNALVADAAQRAIRVHTDHNTSIYQNPEDDSINSSIKTRPDNKIFIFLSSAYALMTFYLVACNDIELSSGIAHITGYTFVILCILPIVSIIAAIVTTSIYLNLWADKAPEKNFLVAIIIGVACGVVVPLIFGALYSSAWV